MGRNERAALARETLEILEQGGYRSPSGRAINLHDSMERALRETRLYRPSDFPDGLPLPAPESGATIFEVTPETTLQAAMRLAESAPGGSILCLNFASAKNPGGGFLGGSQAQEESLARSSGLYPCLLKAQEMYEHNRRLSTCLYSDHMVYSPSVPVFRDDTGRLLEQPYRVAFLSAPAVNAGAVRRNEPGSLSLIEPAMRARTGKLLWVARQHGHETLVLGAWGCGVFGNDPAMVARLFAEQLSGSGRFRGQFTRVTFAIYDHSPNQEVYNTFRNGLRCA